MTDEEIINNEQYHTCGRCKHDCTPDDEYPCVACIHGIDHRTDLWELATENEEEYTCLVCKHFNPDNIEIDYHRAMICFCEHDGPSLKPCDKFELNEAKYNAKRFEPYSTVSPIKGEETKDFFEKYRGYVDVKEGVLYRYVDEPEVVKTDLISREAVLETIEDCNSDGLKGIFCSYDDGKRFEEYIKELPSITPNENEDTNAHWEKREYNDIPDKCSRCGHTYTEYICGFEWEQTGVLPNYCPNCGKKMEVENDE